MCILGQSKLSWCQCDRLEAKGTLWKVQLANHRHLWPSQEPHIDTRSSDIRLWGRMHPLGALRNRLFFQAQNRNNRSDSWLCPLLRCHLQRISAICDLTDRPDRSPHTLVLDSPPFERAPCCQSWLDGQWVPQDACESRADLWCEPQGRPTHSECKVYFLKIVCRSHQRIPMIWRTPNTEEPTITIINSSSSRLKTTLMEAHKCPLIPMHTINKPQFSSSSSSSSNQELAMALDGLSD